MAINYLADFEALLNIIANFGEIAGLLLGFFLICRSAFFGKSDFTFLGRRLGRLSQFFLGIGLIIIGLAIPGIINWFVPSTRCGG